MTVVVGFHCSDGVVIAADSMITPSVGNTAVGHHKGQKVFVLPGERIFAFSGDQGLAMRAVYVVEQFNQTNLPDAMQFVNGIWHETNNELGKTGFSIIQHNPNIATLVAFPFNNTHQVCMFGMGGFYLPMLLNPGNFFVALGSGKQFADPFLRFVVDTFCAAGPPTVADARFYVTWVVQHVIETNPGGVAGPIRIALLSRNGQGQYVASEIPSDDVQEHIEAIAEAGRVLRDWRAGTLAQPPVSEPPPTPPTPPASA